MTDGPPGTPLVRKLGVKEGHRVALVHAPDGWSVPALPSGASVEGAVDRPRFDVVVAFFGQLHQVQDEVPSLTAALAPDGALWAAWPRRAAGHRSDITDTAVRSVALPLGLVDVKVAALGEDWSGLKLVWRKELRHLHT